MKKTAMQLAAAALAATLTLPAWADGTSTDKPRDKFFSTWEAHGDLFAVAPEKLLFQGKFEGMMFTEDGGGLMDGADIVCAASQEFDVVSGATQATGQCAISVTDEDSIFARYECKGAPGKCDGAFILTGGTGAFEKISGGGNYRSRTQLAELAGKVGGNTVVGSAEGIAVWSSVKYSLK